MKRLLLLSAMLLCSTMARGQYPEHPKPKPDPEGSRLIAQPGRLVPGTPRAAGRTFSPLLRVEKQRTADKKFWLVTLGAAAASALAIGAGVHCRNTNGVEPCTGHYGSFWGIQGTQFGITAIAFPAVAYMAKKEGYRWWWTLPAAGAAFNTGYAIREFRQGCKGPTLPNGHCQ